MVDLTEEEKDDDMEQIIFSKEDTWIVISYYFHRVLEVPDEEEWIGTNGAIHKTLRIFNLKYSSKIELITNGLDMYLKTCWKQWLNAKSLTW